jgi:hypothetical protein
MSRRHVSPFVYLALAAVPLVVAIGCENDSSTGLEAASAGTAGASSLRCGPGTIEKAGECLPDASDATGPDPVDPGDYCGEGTKLVKGVCIPTNGSSNTGAAGSVNPCAPGENGIPTDSGAAGSTGSGPAPFGGGGTTSAPTPPPPVSQCNCDSKKEDCDGDGWTVAEGDCCDQIGPCGQRPELQNPGAVEYKGDGVDNDCDGFFDETEKPCDYELSSSPNTANDYVRALDICQFTKENVPIEQRKWGVISATFTTADGNGYPDPLQRSVRKRFGQNIYPLRGGALAVISTGVAADVDDTSTDPPAWPSGATFTNISTSFGNDGEFPSDWLNANDGKLPTGCDESGFESSSAQDSVMLTLRIRVPTNAQSFSFQSLFMSAEFPEFICQDFNDLFLALIRNEYGQPKSPNPVDGNIAFFQAGTGTSIKKYPVGINLAGDDTAQKLFSVCDPKKVGCSTAPVALDCALGDEALKGTGYEVSSSDVFGDECAIGGGTDWLTVAGNVVPGGIMELRILVADVGDDAYDSTVLLDSFTWNATPGTPGTN